MQFSRIKGFNVDIKYLLLFQSFQTETRDFLVKLSRSSVETNQNNPGFSKVSLLKTSFIILSLREMSSGRWPNVFTSLNFER